jgi:hypothetical protein
MGCSGLGAFSPSISVEQNATNVKFNSENSGVVSGGVVSGHG